MAASAQGRCPLCPVRFGNSPLAAQDPSVPKSLTGKKATGKSHDESAPNCVKSAQYLSLCPACSVCGNGDKVTAAAVRDRGEPLEEVKCRLCLADDGNAVAVASRAERRRAEDARRAETDAIHTGRRTDRANEEDWNAVGPDGLTTLERLSDAAFEFKEMGTTWPSAAARDLAYAACAWPHLNGAALEHKARLVHQRLSTILDLAQERKLHTREPTPKQYLPDVEKLAKEWPDDEEELSDRFHGMPAFVWYCMLALFVATLSTSLACYSLAERFVKWVNRGQAQGKSGIFRMILRRRSHGARAAPLYLLEVVLRELGLKPYVGPTIRFTLYKGVPLGLIYALFKISFCLGGVPGLVILLAGCVFGEKAQLAAIFGCTARKGPNEPSVGYDLVGRPSREQTQAVAFAMNCVTSGPGVRVAFRVQRCVSAISPSFDSRGRNHGLGDTDRVFYVFGTNDRELKENGERVFGVDIPRWLDGYADEDAGISRWYQLKSPAECQNALRGNSFSAAINNDRGLYVPRGSYGGRSLDNGFVVDIGRQLDNHPITLAVLERTNLIYTERMYNGPFDIRRMGGPAHYGAELPERERRAALEERSRLMELGHYAYAAQKLYSRYAKPPLLVAIECVDQGAIKAAIDRGDADAVVALLKPVADAITLGIKRIGDALDAGRADGKSWECVANEAQDDLFEICVRRLDDLPPTTAIVPRAVALATLEEKAMREAGWLVPAGRAVPHASGFLPEAEDAPAPAAYGGSGNQRPRTRRRRDAFGEADRQEARAAAEIFAELATDDEDDNMSS